MRGHTPGGGGGNQRWRLPFPATQPRKVGFLRPPGRLPSPRPPGSGARPPAPAPTFLRPDAPRQRQQQQQEEEAEAKQRGRLPGPRGERPLRAHHAPRRGQRGRQSQGIAGCGTAGPGRVSALNPAAASGDAPACQLPARPPARARRQPPPCNRPNRFRVRERGPRRLRGCPASRRRPEAAAGWRRRRRPLCAGEAPGGGPARARRPLPVPWELRGCAGKGWGEGGRRRLRGGLVGVNGPETEPPGSQPLNFLFIPPPPSCTSWPRIFNFFFFFQGRD